MSIHIKEVGLYHPDKVLTNDFFFSHFQQQNKDITHFIADVMGRERRYVINDPAENGLTMAVAAARNVLERANLTGADLDMIVYSTQTPEYTFPTNAMMLHKELGATSKAICNDSNANCAGMLLAVEQTSRYMLSNPRVTRALVVGSDQNFLHCNPNDEVTFANYGDAAAAVILEKTANPGGFIDSRYYSNSEPADKIMFPAAGLSNIYQEAVGPNDLQIRWLPFDGDYYAVQPAIDSIEEILAEHNLTIDDIGALCFSQFSRKTGRLIQEGIGATPEKLVYVGDEFGYTGTSSPFLALYRGLERGQIQRGQYVLFWSVGAGMQIVTMLVKI